MAATERDWLLELTRTPTAAGREQRVMAWVEQWTSSRSAIKLTRDAAGNLLLRLPGSRPQRPIVIEAHMDHPAFVVTGQEDARTLTLQFRGGVHPDYFKDARVLLHNDKKPFRGRVTEVRTPRSDEMDIAATAVFAKDVKAEPGDVVTWDTGRQRVAKDRLHTPACDNLASVAAAMCMLDRLARVDATKRSDVRVLLSRAEEVGFIGAIAACKLGSIPRRSRVIVLENSKSFAESPIGGGPILRVGDRTSTFDPDLTFRLGSVAASLQRDDAAFRWQRKLMPGGTCNASAYHSFGYTSACVCLPLGNYHNMNDRTGRIAAESISLSDFEQFVTWLTAIPQRLDDPAHAPSLRSRLEKLYTRRKHLLDD